MKCQDLFSLQSKKINKIKKMSSATVVIGAFISESYQRCVR